MKICIIHCFDTYEHRVDLLHDYFKAKGTEVTVITSDYMHFEKRKRTDKKRGLPLYKGNSICIKFVTYKTVVTFEAIEKYFCKDRIKRV